MLDLTSNGYSESSNFQQTERSPRFPIPLSWEDLINTLRSSILSIVIVSTFTNTFSSMYNLFSRGRSVRTHNNMLPFRMTLSVS